MENEKKVWETKEFREAKKNFQLDKKCYQCGSQEELTPHHLISYKDLVFGKLREIAIIDFCKQKNVTFTHSAITKSGGFSTSGGYIKALELYDFIRSHPEFKEKAHELAKVEYYEFSNIQTLCKRCHFAIEKGMILCYLCKKNYHPISFSSCYNCKEEHERNMLKGIDEIEQMEDEFEKEINEIEFSSNNLPNKN